MIRCQDQCHAEHRPQLRMHRNGIVASANVSCGDLLIHTFLVIHFVDGVFSLFLHSFSMSTVFIIPQRYVLTFMCFFGLVNAYTMRLSLSFAITQMVVHPTTPNVTNSTNDLVCPFNDVTYNIRHLDIDANQSDIDYEFFSEKVICFCFCPPIFGIVHHRPKQI